MFCICFNVMLQNGCFFLCWNILVTNICGSSKSIYPWSFNLWLKSNRLKIICKFWIFHQRPRSWFFVFSKKVHALPNFCFFIFKLKNASKTCLFSFFKLENASKMCFSQFEVSILVLWLSNGVSNLPNRYFWTNFSYGSKHFDLPVLL